MPEFHLWPAEPRLLEEATRMVECPQCNADIDVEEDELDEGDTISCDECGATLSVAGFDPLELEADGEDDDDEDDDDFYEDEEDDEDDEEEDDEEEEW
jgi:alpha-aminoadipate carrier protein LysW